MATPSSFVIKLDRRVSSCIRCDQQRQTLAGEGRGSQAARTLSFVMPSSPRITVTFGLSRVPRMNSSWSQKQRSVLKMIPWLAGNTHLVIHAECARVRRGDHTLAGRQYFLLLLRTCFVVIVATVRMIMAMAMTITFSSDSWQHGNVSITGDAHYDHSGAKMHAICTPHVSRQQPDSTHGTHRALQGVWTCSQRCVWSA